MLPARGDISGNIKGADALKCFKTYNDYYVNGPAAIACTKIFGRVIFIYSA